jgi:hypothetical protein
MESVTERVTGALSNMRRLVFSRTLFMYAFLSRICFFSVCHSRNRLSFVKKRSEFQSRVSFSLGLLIYNSHMCNLLKVIDAVLL